MMTSKKKDPKVRCFDVVFGGGARENTEREGKTWWPHALHLRINQVDDVEQVVKQGIDWLRDNGSKALFDREPFTIDKMGEIVETDPDSGAPLKETVESCKNCGRSDCPTLQPGHNHREADRKHCGMCANCEMHKCGAFAAYFTR